MEIRNIHEKFVARLVKLIAPAVFYFGAKENKWNLSTRDLLGFPIGTLGNELGKFYSKQKIDPIPRAESHDVFHVLLGYSTSIKDELALQFFLYGNGKTSLASIGSTLGAWFLFPGSWSYFEDAYLSGKRCADVSALDFKNLLREDFTELKTSLIHQ